MCHVLPLLAVSTSPLISLRTLYWAVVILALASVETFCPKHSRVSRVLEVRTTCHLNEHRSNGTDELKVGARENSDTGQMKPVSELARTRSDRISLAHHSRRAACLVV